MKHFKLYGFLADEFGADHFLDVQSPAEAVRALCCTIEGFENRIVAEQEFGFALFVDNLTVVGEDMHLPSSEKEIIKLVPELLAAKNGLTTILIGIAFIALAFATNGVSLTWTQAAGWTMTATTLGGMALNMGVAMVMGGIAGLLAGSPSQGSLSGGQHPAFVFSGAVNTTAQGGPIGVLYGRLLIGSQIISSGIDSNVFPNFSVFGAKDSVGTVAGNGDSSPWVSVIAPVLA